MEFCRIVFHSSRKSDLPVTANLHVIVSINIFIIFGYEEPFGSRRRDVEANPSCR